MKDSLIIPKQCLLILQKRYKKYGSQKGWERVNQAPPEGDGFQEITEEEARQMELPF